MARWKRLFLVFLSVCSLLSLLVLLVEAGKQKSWLPAVSQGQTASVNDGFLLQWAQSISETERTVLLQWRDQDGAPFSVYLPAMLKPGESANRLAPASREQQAAISSYTVYRRVAGQTQWQAVGTARPAANAAEMVRRMGQELVDWLAETEELPGENDVYNFVMGDSDTIRMYSQRFYEIGLTRGTAFLDKSAGLNDVLEYYVSGDNLQRYTPVKVDPSDVLDPPTGLTEVFPGPAALGKQNSSYPDNTDLRYRYDQYNQLRGWDGSVSLYWDTPSYRDAAMDVPADSREAIGIVGYYVYRAHKGSLSWTLVNKLGKCGKLMNRYCYLPVQVSALHGETVGIDYYHFRDHLTEAFTDPAQIYREWDYKVCTVDLLGGESCSQRITGTSRDLNPPLHPSGMQVEQPDGGPVTIRWSYQPGPEVSGPLRFYVTRHPTLTAPLDQWEPVLAGNGQPYQTASLTGVISLSISDDPPKGTPYWYKIQVRDNAGNFSAESAPMMGALFNRDAAPLADIPYDKDNCATNPWPLILTGLDSSYWTIAINRGFTPTGPWTFISRAPVVDGTAEIFDDYQPPVGRDVYYALEGVDRSGNVSAPRHYCVHLEGNTVPPPPGTDQGAPYFEGGDWWVPHEFTGTTDTATVMVSQPGMAGTVTDTSSGAASPHNQNVNLGAWLEMAFASEDGGVTGDGVIVYSHPTNNFLNTQRQMTDLGAVQSAQWVSDSSGLPAVRLDLSGTCDQCRSLPLVAAFRRIPGGNWFQVTPVQAIPRPSADANWIISDTTDLSLNESYQYVVLAFSPDSYEVLGFWGPTTIAAQISSQLPIELTPVMAAGPTWNRLCTVWDSYPPGTVGMPATIYLPNGWQLNVQGYWASSGGGICTFYSTIDPDRLYGEGTLTNGSDSYTTRFAAVGIYPDSGLMKSGRIVYKLDSTSSGANQFTVHINRLEFTPTQANAEIVLTLPEHINVVDPSQGRSNQIYYVASGLTTNYRVNTFIANDLLVVDENLPWAIQYQTARINELSVGIPRGGQVTTLDRFTYAAPSLVNPAVPDNNLAFMRANFSSSSFLIDSQGMQGSFSSNDAIQYSTSVPASVVVSASGANLVIQDSAITSGALINATARLDYMDQDTARDYMLKDGRCSPSDPVVGYAWCHNSLSAQPLSYRTLNLQPADPDIVLGVGAVFTPEVNLSGRPSWTVYEVDTTRGTLYVAPGVFAETPTSWAPMPAENGWARLPARDGIGDLDPGLNIIQDTEPAIYRCYTPPQFPWSVTELYLRRGGVSEYFRTGEDLPSERVNIYNYQEKVYQAELSLLDNSEQPLDYRTDLILPYPSEVDYPLQMTGIDQETHCPAAGDIRVPTTVVHRFWEFQETPQSVQYLTVTDKYGTLPANQEKLLSVRGSALIDGLHPQSTLQPGLAVSRTLVVEWFPDGDAGDIRLANGDLPASGYRVAGLPFALSDIKLSRYHSIPLNSSSKPDTVLIKLSNNAMELPAELLDGVGNLTPDSLLNCSQSVMAGCGFILLDGEGAVSYMGEIQQFAGSSLRPGSTTAVPVDEIFGKFPVVTNKVIDAAINMVVSDPSFHLVWPVGSMMVNSVFEYYDLPIRFLANSMGGALVGLVEHASILPGDLPHLLSADLAATITVDWNNQRGYDNQIGLFAGYPASQAAFRALAMNRPPWDQAGVQPFDRWQDVEADIIKWAGLFGYALDPGPDNSQDDPVDLAQEIWESGWCGSWSPSATDPNRVCTQVISDLSQTYAILEPIMQEMNGGNDYGGTGLTSGASLLGVDVILSDGGGQAVFAPVGLSSLGFQRFDFGTRFVLKSDSDFRDANLVADWLSLSFTKDGLFTFRGSQVNTIIVGEYGIESDIMFLYNSSPSNEHIEGGIEIPAFEIPYIVRFSAAGVLGGGYYDGEQAGFIGLRGSITDLDLIGIGAQGSVMLIGGLLPAESLIIREFGFGEVLDKFSNEGTGGPAPYTGAYFTLAGDWPLVGKTCLISARGGGEFRGWYFQSQQGEDKYGGQLEAHITAQLLCLISGRGQVTLGFEKLLDTEPVSSPDPSDPDWGPLPRYCDNPTPSPTPIPDLGGCRAVTGDFWVAVGVGWCSPESWHSWSGAKGNWWGDDWCYTIGANVGVSALAPPDQEGYWAWEADFRAE